MDRERLVDLLEAVRGIRAAVSRMEEEVLRALTTGESEKEARTPHKDIADEWFTLAELGEWLKVSRTTAYRLVRVKRIPAYRIGRAIRVRRRDVERWLEDEGRGY